MDKEGIAGPFFVPQEREAILNTIYLTATNSIAATGSVQSQAATALTDIAIVTTATSASADCFKLRSGVTTTGYERSQFVINRAAAQVRVFCPTGGILNGVTNGSVTLASAAHGQFLCINRATNEYVKV